MNNITRLSLVICLVLLSGCAQTRKAYNATFHPDDVEVVQKAAPSCPTVGVVPEANAFPAFKAGSAQKSPKDLVAAGYIGVFRGDCTFKDGKEAVFDLEINFGGTKGPMGRVNSAKEIGSAVFPYFVAVVSSDETILQRQAFSTKVDFDNKTDGVSKEEHTIRIPVTSPDAAHGYKIVIGFSLTPEQVAFNKQQGNNK